MHPIAGFWFGFHALSTKVVQSYRKNVSAQQVKNWLSQPICMLPNRAHDVDYLRSLFLPSLLFPLDSPTESLAAAKL